MVSRCSASRKLNTKMSPRLEQEFRAISGEEGWAGVKIRMRFAVAGEAHRAKIGSALSNTAQRMISFVVPAHNEQACLPATLTAIHSSARTLGLKYEIIVVDDASTDRTAAIARDHQARVVSVNHRQIAATRNAGSSFSINARPPRNSAARVAVRSMVAWTE